MGLCGGYAGGCASFAGKDGSAIDAGAVVESAPAVFGVPRTITATVSGVSTGSVGGGASGISRLWKVSASAGRPAT